MRTPVAARARRTRLARRRWWAGASGIALITVTACSATIVGSAQTAPRTVGSSGSAVSSGSAGPSGSAVSSRTAVSSGSAEPTDVVLDPGGYPNDDTAPLDFPAMPPMGQQAHVQVDGRGVLTIAIGTPKLVIDEYQDPICPPCAQFWADNGRDLSKAVADGKIALRLHSANFLDDKSASGDYSTRADASLLAVADLAGPNEVLRWQTALYSSVVQPEENAAVDHTSQQLGYLATYLDMPKEVSLAIAADTYRRGALDAAANTYDDLAKAGVVSVPATLVAARRVDTGRSNWLSELIGG